MYRWATCPGSVRLSKGIPNRSSKYAQEGTDAHEWAAKLATGEAMMLDAPEDMREALQEMNTVVWNGPLGFFEREPFDRGTIEIARILAFLPHAVTVVGGGETAAAVQRAGVADRISHVSTGGGASLEMLQGIELPGVAVLMDK